ncbi:MAG: AAA family ATPase [Alphaproteobacteria bacterium]
MTHPLTNAPWGFFAAEDFQALELPPREVLMPPWLLTNSINMLYAKAGIGKSNFALGLSVALARGEPFLGFTPARQARVVYVDGEMPSQELMRRLDAMTGKQGTHGNLFVYSMAQCESPFRIKHLNTEEGQQELMCRVDDVGCDLLVLDNKSTLFSNMRENDSGTWDNVQSWLMALRSSGMAILILHHAGKGGDQRGSSQHNVVNDITIELYEPAGPEPDEGSHFVVNFDKKRHLQGKESKPTLVRLMMTDQGAIWHHEPYTGGRKVDPRRQQAIVLHEQGVGQREIARQLKASPSTINTWVNESEAA